MLNGDSVRERAYENEIGLEEAGKPHAWWIDSIEELLY